MRWFSRKPKADPPPPPPVDDRRMSEDWKVGDLAVCVSDTWYNKDHLALPDDPKKGEMFKVSRVYEQEMHGRLAVYLQFEEKSKGRGWENTGFRKIKPDAEPCEDEFTVLIKRMRPIKNVPARVGEEK